MRITTTNLFARKEDAMTSSAETLENAYTLALQSVENLEPVEWDIPNVCGPWTVKDIMAHLTFYQHVLADALHSLLGKEPTPSLSKWLSTNQDELNQAEVEAQGGKTAQQVMQDLDETQAQVLSLLKQIPTDVLDQKGRLADFGQAWTERTLNDLILGIARHTRKHCEQIQAFRAQRHA